jgi:hypothetical protein
MMPGDVVAFLSLRLADLWESPSGREVRKRRFSTPAQTKELEQTLGLTPPEIERLTLVVVGPEPDSLVAMVTPTRAVPPNLLEMRLLEGAVQKEIKGNKYMAGRGRAFGSPHPFLNVFGSQKGFEDLLRRDPHPADQQAWKEMLKCAREKPNLLAGSASGEQVLRALDRILKGRHGQRLRALAALRDMQFATVTGRLGPQSDLELRVRFADEESARKGLGAVQAGLALFKDTLPDIQKALQKIAGAERGRSYCQSLEAALNKAVVAQKGKEVTLSVRLKTDWVKIVPDLMDALPKNPKPQRER